MSARDHHTAHVTTANGRPTCVVAAPPGPGPAGLLVVLAVELAVFVGLLAVYAVVAEAYRDALRAATAPGRLPWGVLGCVASGLGALSVILATRCVRHRWPQPALVLWAAALMYGTVSIGALAAEQAAAAARRHPWQAVAAALPAQAPRAAGHPTAPRPASPVPTAATAAGDPTRGRQAYVATCAACHGHQGQGVAALAPGLRDAAFLRNATDAQLWSVIVAGRAADAPESTSGRLMPPRGGNPFLQDEQVHDIIAYLHELAGGAAADGPGNGAAAVSFDPETLLPRWVVPLSASGPAGLAEPLRAALSRAALTQLSPAAAPVPPDGPLANVYRGFVGLLGFHMALALAVAAWLLVRVWEGGDADRVPAVGRAARAQWWAAAVAWLVLLPLFHRMP